jgi:hypothetical protein
MKFTTNNVYVALFALVIITANKLIIAEMNGSTFYSKEPMYTANVPKYLKDHNFTTASGKDQHVNIAYKEIAGIPFDLKEKHEISPEKKCQHMREAEAKKEEWLKGKKYSYEGKAALAHFIKTNGKCINCDLTGQDLLAAYAKLTDSPETGSPEINLSGSILTSIPFFFADYTGAFIKDCDVSGSWLTNSNFSDTIFWNVKADETLFSEEDVSTYHGCDGYVARVRNLNRKREYYFKSAENSRKFIQNAQECISKRSVEDSYFEDFKYHKIANYETGWMENGRLMTWEDTERELKSLIQYHELDIQKCDEKIVEINNKIAEMRAIISERNVDLNSK